MQTHLTSSSQNYLEEPTKRKHDSLPHLVHQRHPIIKLNRELNFFVDFERFKRLSMPKKPRNKKIVYIPVNIHTAKLKHMKSGPEIRRSPDFSFPKKTQKFGSLIDSSKSPSLKFIDLHLGDMLQRRKSNNK